MSPFDLNNPLVKNTIFIGHYFGQRPSSILQELFEAKFNAEDAYYIDSKATQILIETLNQSTQGYDKHGNYLKAKWAGEDAQLNNNMKDRERKYQNLSKQLKKK